MTIVIDASVAIKWLIDEEGSDTARRLLVGELLVAPDFIILECANVLWAATRRTRLTQGQAAAALFGLQALPVRFLPTADYGNAAQAIAFELEHPVYDCLYLTIALQQKATLVTADRKFMEHVVSHGRYSHAVRLLESD